MTALEEIKKGAQQINPNVPELLWLAAADDDGEHEVWFDPDEGGTAYIRADVVASALESLQRENEALKNLIDGDNCADPDKIDALFGRAEAAEAEVKRLEAEIDRKSSMPGDHRYWEGRYRDEAAENEKLREALTPFVLAFESRRETYSKRYRSNRQLGYANFDKMPDDWAMEKVAFSMGTYRCAHKALSSAGRDPLKEFDALVEGPSFTEIASTGGEHHAE